MLNLQKNVLNFSHTSHNKNSIHAICPVILPIEKDFPFAWTNIISMTCHINININWKRLTGNFLDLYSVTKETNFSLTLAKWFSIMWVINEI